MALSTEIPKAILNTKIVEGFSGMPKYPINPEVMQSGKIFVIKEAATILNERNKYSIKNAIVKMAKSNDSIKLCAR